MSQLNDLFKYADDTTLLIPEHTDTDIDVEFSHIKAWASTNHLSLNLTKTKEIVFRRPPYRTSDLRNRGHLFQLPEYTTDLHKKSFIIRALYKYV